MNPFDNNFNDLILREDNYFTMSQSTEGKYKYNN